MASGGNDRQTGTVPKTKARNNCNVPQEVVTPTRRDIHSTNIMANSVDWLPVSEHNSRQTQNRGRKPTNAPATDNDYGDLELSIGQEGGSRFVPVRPQPRTLVLRQRDSMMDNPDESTYNSILAGHSPHTSHTAVMIVNPTTPNSNQTNQNINLANSGARNSGRGPFAGRDTVFVNNTVPIGPYPVVNNTNTKSNNLVHDVQESSHHNGVNQHNKNDITDHNHQNEQGSTRTENARALGDSLVTACPDTARVEQRLGQIREYIRVTSTLVDSMRNSEDEDPDMQDDSDIEELRETLKNLKDSEAKLENMLSDTLDNDNDDDQIIPVQNVLSENYIINSPQGELLQNVNAAMNANSKEKDESVKITEIDNASLNCREGNMDNEKSDSVDEALPRPSSVQSSGSGYSDNDLWHSEMKAKMEVSQLRLAAALQEQKRLLKYQAEAKEQLSEMSLQNGHPDNAGAICNHEGGNQHQQQQETALGYASTHQPLASQNAGRLYGSNQIGVATTLPHVADSNGCRARTSSHLPDAMESSRETEDRNRGVALSAPVLPSDQAEIDMLRDLQMRRQHLESQILQVAKMQNLHTGASSVGDASSETQSASGTLEGRDTRGVKAPLGNANGGGGPEEAASWAQEDEEEGSNNLEGTIKTKIAAVNVMKIELERLKSMLRTVDSIQNNFGINTTFEEYVPYDNPMLSSNDDQNRNQNRLADVSSFNNVPLCRTDSSQSANMMKESQGASHAKNQNTSLGLSRLQNCISSGSNKCTNVSEQQHQSGGENISLGLAAIQQLTQQMKQEVQGISEERRRLKHASNRDICTSSGSSIKSDDKKRTNSVGGGHSNASSNNYPNPGPIERRQLSLKAELEAKKKQLERLMSKEVDHRTNQQPQLSESENSSKASVIAAERSGLSDEATALNPTAVAVSTVQRNSLRGPPAEDDDCGCSVHVRTDADNGYSSDQDEDGAYCGTPHTQLNVNQLSGGASSSHKTASAGSSPENFKTSSFYGDSVRSPDGSFVSQHAKHNRLPRSTGNKQRNREPPQPRDPPRHRHLQETSSRRASEDRMFHSNRLPQDCRVIPEPSSSPRASASEREAVDLPSSSRSIGDSLIRLPGVNRAAPPGGVCREPHDGSMSNDSRIDTTEVCSRPDSGASSVGDREPDGVPPPMAALPVRQHRHAHKNDQDMGQSQWHNPHSEAQLAMWWQNKANQLQHQLEMTSNLCQSLLQDRRAGQVGGMPPPLSSGALMPGSTASALGWWGGPAGEASAGPWWAMMQQQQQLATAAWGGNCLQHMLAQQRELSSLRTALSNLEEKVRWMSCTTRTRSSPPNAPRSDAAPSSTGRSAQNVQWPPQISDSYLPGDEQDFTAYALEHGIRPPANFIGPHLYEQSSDGGSVSTVTYNASAASLPPAVFNDCASLARPNLNNVNIDCPTKTTAVPCAEHAVGGRAPINRSAALNNQVPPGNRTNNYWDNFRSYSRQNLLSGSAKMNADQSFPTHGPHPLAERSHNTLRSSVGPSQTTNAPKRNVDNPPGNLNVSPNSRVNPLSGTGSADNSDNRRGRRNFPRDLIGGPAPPDVLNVNQNSEVEPIRPSSNGASSISRFCGPVNIDPNEFAAQSSVPEIIRAHSDDLNMPKKKSSSKLPAKNTPEVNTERQPEDLDPKLFDMLRENVYSEVTALIDANESRPHFLIRLFRDLRQMSANPQGQRALRSIREVASLYASAAEPRDGSDDRSIQRASVDGEGRLLEVPESVSFNEDQTAEMLHSFRSMVLSAVGDSEARSRVDHHLRDAFTDILNHQRAEVGDSLVATVSEFLNTETDYAHLREHRQMTLMGEARPTDGPEASYRRLELGEPSGHGTEASGKNENASTAEDEASGVNHRISGAPEPKIDLIESVESYNGDLAEADQSRRGPDDAAGPSMSGGASFLSDAALPDVVDAEEQTPTEAEAEWLGLDRVPTRLQTDDCPGNQSDSTQS